MSPLSQLPPSSRIISLVTFPILGFGVPEITAVGAVVDPD
jgi:hypothetical protein